MTYSEQLKSPLWQKKRLEIFERDGFCCKGCNSSQNQIHVHHGVYIKGLMAWEYDSKYLHTLCSDCHSLTTMFMKDIYNTIGECNPNDLWDLDWLFKSIRNGDLEKLRIFAINIENNEWV